MNAIAGLIVILAVLGQSSLAGSSQGGADGGQKAPGATTQPDAAANNLEQLKRAAARYRIAVGADGARELAVVPEPVLSWTNPLRRTFAGATFVWVADGRPEVVGSLYRFTEDGRTVEDDEFQSLSTTSVTATRSNQQVWAPREPGIVLAPIPGAPTPSRSPSERLRQMRALANEFHAFVDTDNDKTELRLLPKPLYRYQTNGAELLEGALFAFVLTTDPEVLLAIEARQVEGKPVWHFGFARMSMINLRAKHKDRDVWKVDWAGNFRDPAEPYVTLRATDLADR